MLWTISFLDQQLRMGVDTRPWAMEQAQRGVAMMRISIKWLIFKDQRQNCCQSSPTTCRKTIFSIGQKSRLSKEVFTFLQKVNWGLHLHSNEPLLSLGLNVAGLRAHKSNKGYLLNNNGENCNMRDKTTWLLLQKFACSMNYGCCQMTKVILFYIGTNMVDTADRIDG